MTSINNPEKHLKHRTKEGLQLRNTLYDLPKTESVSSAVLRKLFIASAIAFVFLLIEAVGGVISGSLAILSDAAHMLSDLSGFFISIMSIWIGTRPASKNLTFGYHRSEVIGALASIALIWGLTIALVFEATNRIIDKSMVENSLFMLCIAIFGLFSNLGMAKVLHSSPGHSHNHDHNHDGHKHGHKHSHQKKIELSSPCKHIKLDEENQSSPSEKSCAHTHHEEKNSSHHSQHENKHSENEHNHCHGQEQKKSIESNKSADECEDSSSSKNLSDINDSDNYNLRAAMIHVIGDVIQSVGVVIAALLIYLFGSSEEYDYWHLADPICTYLFSILVMFIIVKIVKDCIRVLMEGTPEGFEVEKFRQKLSALEDVIDIHDLHIWSLSAGKPSMSVHLFAKGDKNAVLKQSTKLCRENGIYHSTIQVEEWENKDQPDFIKCNHNIHY